MRSFVVVMALVAFAGGAVAAEDVTPLPRAHSHNDYEHERPLVDALDHGFCSIEADIWLVDGNLLVAHHEEDVKPERTLEALYLAPLLERVRKNDGQVFPGGPDVTLLVDLKNTPQQTLAALMETLKSYAEMLTSFTRDATETRAVTVIVSGMYNRNALIEQSPRVAAVDGRPPHLGKSCHDVPLVSENWFSLFTWKGVGEMPAGELGKLREMVAKAHAAGQRIRFWNLPAGDAALSLLFDEGIDLLNADDLAAMRKFLLQRMNTSRGEKP